MNVQETPLLKRSFFKTNSEGTKNVVTVVEIAQTENNHQVQQFEDQFEQSRVFEKRSLEKNRPFKIVDADSQF